MLTSILLALATAVAGNAANNLSPSTGDDQTICRRETPTGSLIASREVCMTKAEWNALERDYLAGVRRTADDMMGRRPGT